MSRVVFAARRARQLREKLSRLFDYEMNGQKQIPLVMDASFVHGYVQIAAKALKFGRLAIVLVLVELSRGP